MVTSPSLSPLGNNNADGNLITSANNSTTATDTPDSTPKSRVTMSSNTYKYKVKMTCGGCSNAVSRALAKAQGEGAGIDDYKVILDDQYVEVTGTIPLDELTKRIEKTGKEILEKPEIPAAEPVAVA